LVNDPRADYAITLKPLLDVDTRDEDAITLSRHVFRASDIRLMEDVTGRGHTHVDRRPAAVYILLKD